MNTSKKEKPILEFKDQSELDACLAYWKNKLFLNDWLITARVIPLPEFEDEDCSGENLMSFEKKESIIHIACAVDFEDSPFKFCQEKILVHELLHCLYNFIESDETYESKFVDSIEHQRLESMAKSLLMIKYDIHLEWFME